jgi:hypothetical protein
MIRIETLPYLKFAGKLIAELGFFRECIKYTKQEGERDQKRRMKENQGEWKE